MNVPNRTEFELIIENAQKAGKHAAILEREKWKKNQSNTGQMIAECGGAHLILKVDGRSKMGKFLSSIEETPLPNLTVTKSSYHGGYVLHILNMCPFQEQIVRRAAELSALEVLKNSLHVDGYVWDYAK